MSECSSVDSSTVVTLSSSSSDDSKDSLKATELRLCLPGSQSPERDRNLSLSLLCSSKYNGQPLFPLKDGVSSSSQRAAVSRSKRGFSDAAEDFVHKTPSEAKWSFKSCGSDTQKAGGEAKLSMNGCIKLSIPNSKLESFGTKEQPVGSQALAKELPPSDSNNSSPATQAQIVGWPPIRSFRKNILATSSNNCSPISVKVSMDGAPYLRKLDIRTYETYQELSLGLEKIFSSFRLGQCESNIASGGENKRESKLKDILHGSEYVLTYEDKDGDWMLVGDVLWEMFIDSCKRLKIVKSSDAIGLAPRGLQKPKSAY